MREKKITILYGLPDMNNGGTALGMSLVEGLQEVFPGSAIAYVSFHSKKALLDGGYPFMRDSYPDLKILPFPMQTRSDSAIARGKAGRRRMNLIWLAKTLLSPLALIFPGLLGGETVRWMKESDLVVVRGTQVFYDLAGHTFQNVISKYMLCFPILLARRLGVPCVVYPQSFGPLRSAAARRLVSDTLNGTDLVLVREELSLRYLEKIGVKKNKMKLVPDSVFALAPPSPEEVAKACRKEGLRERTYIVFVMRELTEPGQNIRDHFHVFAAILRDLLARGSVDAAAIVTQCHGFEGYRAFESDEQVSADLHRFLQKEFGERALLLSRPWNPRDAIALYGGARYVVSVRLHSAIFGLLAGTPAMALSYLGHKTKGVMALAGLDDLMFTFSDVAAGALAGAVVTMEEDYEGALSRITGAASRMREEARRTPALLVDYAGGDHDR